MAITSLNIQGCIFANCPSQLRNNILCGEDQAIFVIFQMDLICQLPKTDQIFRRCVTVTEALMPFMEVGLKNKNDISLGPTIVHIVDTID